MAPLTDADSGTKGDFKNQQFAEKEVADKVVEQCGYNPLTGNTVS